MTPVAISTYLCAMQRILSLVTLTLLTGTSALAQCSIDLPADTVTVHWGYEPLACTVLDPVVSGAAPLTVTWSNGATGGTLTVCDTISGWYTATLTDDTLCTAVDSVFLNVVDVRCGNNNNKVLVCHIPPGNPGNAHTICISANGVPAHLAHGCTLGSCTTVPDSLQGTGQLQLLTSPNPMYSEATVQLRSRIQQHVRLRVVDALGRELEVLLDAELSAQEERFITVDAARLPQGTSMVWIEARGSSDRVSQRLVLVR